MDAVMTKESKDHEIGTGMKEKDVKPLLENLFQLDKNNEAKIYEILKKYLPDELKEILEEKTKYPIELKATPGIDFYKFEQFRKNFEGLSGPDELMDEVIKMGEILYNMYLEAFYDENTKEHKLPRSIEEFESRVKKVLESHEKDIEFIATNPVLAGMFYSTEYFSTVIFRKIYMYFRCKYYKEHPEEEYRLDIAPSEQIEKIIRQNIWLLEQEKDLIKFLFKYIELEDQILLLLYTGLFYAMLSEKVSDKAKEWFKKEVEKRGWDTEYLDPDKVYTRKRIALGKKKWNYDQHRHFEIGRKAKELVFDYLLSRGIKYIYIWGDSIINELGRAKLQVLRTAKIKGLKITKEEAERIRDTFITTIKEIRTVNKDRETAEFYIYKIDVEKAREWKWLPISPNIWTLLVKAVWTLNSEQRLETYIENTKELIRKIQEGKINLREDFVEIDPFKFDRILLSYKDPYLRTRINKDTLLLHFLGGPFLSLWNAILIEQLAIITTKKVKEELDKKTRKMSEDKIKEKGIKLIIKYIIDKNPYHRFKYYRWSNILSDKRIKQYFYHFGIIPRIAFVLGKDKNGEETIIELGELNTPVDLLKAFVRAAEVSREFERTFEEKEPVLPDEIYEKISEIEKTFTE